MKVFADNLRRRAAELNLSNAEVARRAGLAERRYGNYVIGRREPDLATLLRIAQVLGQTVDQLLRPNDDTAISPSAAIQSRLLAAINSLDDRDRESLAIQAEALVQASHRRV